MTRQLEFAGVGKRFGGHVVLTQVSLQVCPGDAVGLVGTNGAGKTTLLRIAAGLVVPDAGAVRWSDIHPAIRYFGGEATLPPDVAARRWASLFNVVADDRRLIGQLSRGNRQLLGLRVVLAGTGRDLLLLDEPWEGLDPAGAVWLTQTLTRWRASGAALLISSHRLHDLDAVCTRFIMLEDGRCRPIAGGLESRPRVQQLASAFVRRDLRS